MTERSLRGVLSRGELGVVKEGRGIRGGGCRGREGWGGEQKGEKEEAEGGGPGLDGRREKLGLK